MHRLLTPFTLGALLLASVSASVSALSAQSLAEVAKKEKERRAKLTGPQAPTVTERELRNAEGPMTQVTGSTTVTASDEDASSEEQAEAQTETGPVRDEAYWKGRLSPIDQQIRDIEQKLQSAQYNSNARGAIERQRLERNLEQARSERAALIVEARRAGAPPGWLR